ncbi:aminoglycoside phosphotransferase family protein [Kitasatospora sp. NBC_01560]|uniref:phosphotransferase n=1 Tax=Kitasatospora sp. NBC_01560 TaxID=2975965 RepID=UPI00386B8486
MLVPPEVVSSLPGTPADARQQSLSGSWGSRNLARVTTEQLDVVVKRWQGSRRLAMAAAETSALTTLASAGFHQVARVVALGGAPVLHPPGAHCAWTAQEYLQGLAPPRHAVGDQRFSRELGTVLARFHLALARPGHLLHAGSRLDELQLLPELTGLLPPTEAALVGAAFDLAVSRMEEVLAFPLGLLHGDLNLENLLQGPNGLQLIDLEFSRVDVRLLDLAALAAPTRDSAGRLQLAPEGFVRSVGSAYQEELNGTGIRPDSTQLALLPIVSLLHFLLILTDQLRARSPHVASVLPVVPQLALRAGSFARRRRRR